MSRRDHELRLADWLDGWTTPENAAADGMDGVPLASAPQSRPDVPEPGFAGLMMGIPAPLQLRLDAMLLGSPSLGPVYRALLEEPEAGAEAIRQVTGSLTVERSTFLLTAVRALLGRDLPTLPTVAAGAWVALTTADLPSRSGWSPQFAATPAEAAQWVDEALGRLQSVAHDYPALRAEWRALEEAAQPLLREAAGAGTDALAVCAFPQDLEQRGEPDDRYPLLILPADDEWRTAMRRPRQEYQGGALGRVRPLLLRIYAGAAPLEAGTLRAMLEAAGCSRRDSEYGSTVPAHRTTLAHVDGIAAAMGLRIYEPLLAA